MTQTLLDDLRMFAAREAHRGVGMAEIVQASPREPRSGDHALEEAIQRVRVQGAAVSLGEDIAAVLVGGAEGEALLSLALAVGP